MDPVIGCYQQKAEKLKSNITLVAAVDVIFNMARELDRIAAIVNKPAPVVPELKKKHAKLS